MWPLFFFFFFGGWWKGRELVLQSQIAGFHVQLFIWVHWRISPCDTSPWVRRMVCWFQDMEMQTILWWSSHLWKWTKCQIQNSETRVLWCTFVSQLAEAWAWQSSNLWRLRREHGCPGVGCCCDHLKIQISFIIPVIPAKVKCTARECYRLDEDSA